MVLIGKLVSQISIKSSGNVFFDLFRNPNKFSSTIIEKVDLERGQWGTVGSIVCYHFTLDGEKKFAREIAEAVDEEKKSVTYSVIEGDLMDAYKTIKVIIDVDDIDDTSCMVTFTIVYEKLTEAMPDPHSFMDASIHFSKEIERHCATICSPASNS